MTLASLVFPVALLAVSLVATWVMLTRVRIMDVPTARSAHTVATPKSGGLAIVVTLLLGIVAIYLRGWVQIEHTYFLGFVFSSLTIAAVSFYDDVTNKAFLVKLATQLLAVAVALSAGIVIDVISLPFVGDVPLGWLAYPVSFLWILGLTNAFNFMDGLDGLAAGVAVIASAFLLLITLRGGSTFVYVMCYAVGAGALGFLVFNFPPARIFMGDVGSATLGFVFATLAIIGARYDASHTSLMVTPLLLFTFIYDTSTTFLRRLLAGERVTEAHRTHLYQLCHRLGASDRTVALGHYAATVGLGLLAIWMVGIGGSARAGVFLPVLGAHLVYSAIVLRRARKAGLLL